MNGTKIETLAELHAAADARCGTGDACVTTATLAAACGIGERTWRTWRTKPPAEGAAAALVVAVLRGWMKLTDARIVAGSAGSYGSNYPSTWGARLFAVHFGRYSDPLTMAAWRADPSKLTLACLQAAHGAPVAPAVKVASDNQARPGRTAARTSSTQDRQIVAPWMLGPRVTHYGHRVRKGWTGAYFAARSACAKLHPVGA